MPRPRMFMCYLCGREYGSASLPIHIPQCQKKWLIEEEKKPKRERRPLPQPPKEIDQAINAGKTLTAAEMDKMNEDSYKQFEEKSLERCPHCERTFRPEAFVKHKKICTAAKPFRKAGTGLGSESLSTKLPPGAISGTLRQTVDLHNLPSSRTSEQIRSASRGPPPRPRTPQGTSSPSATAGFSSARPQALSKTMPPSQPKAVKPKAQSMSSPNAAAALSATQQKCGTMAPFCDECGLRFERQTSKFCPECGTPRLETGKVP